MLTPDLLRRIRRIEFRTRRLVRNSFSGAYHSLYKGRGLAFAAVRPYLPGDDVRLIDWKVTARAREPFIRQYTEERELTVMLVMDASPSVFFGTQDRQKRDLAAELGAVLAYTAISNGDKVGLILFSDQVEHYIPPRKGRNHILRLIRDLLTVQPSGRGTDLAAALQVVNRAVPTGAIVFLLSDFLMAGASYARDLGITGKQHQTIAIVVSDPLETAFPTVGIMGLRDAESGQVEWVDTASPTWQRDFQAQQARLRQERDQTLTRAGVARIDLPPDGDYVKALTVFFQQQGRQ
jgi:uncharacterized protein (DUF58 family)